jgi:hypothetical protein
MLRNRAFLVKMVKDVDAIDEEHVEPVDVDELARTVTKYAILVIAAYMGADTLRQVVVHTAQTIIQES